MTKHQHSTRGSGLDGFYDTLRRPGVARASQGRWFGGVAAGLARWLGVDPLVIRAAFIFTSIFFGMGLTLYLLLVLLMPDERGNIHLERALKFGEGGPITLLVITGISVLGGGPWWGGDVNGMRVGGYVLLGVGIWWFLTRTDSGRRLIASKPWSSSGGSATSATPGEASLWGAAGAAGTSPWSAPTGAPAAPPSTGAMSTGNAAAAAGVALEQSPGPFTPGPVHTRTPSVGFAGGLLVLGLAAVAGAGAAALATVAGWTGNHIALGIAAGLGVLGLSLVVAGLAGRRGGWLQPFAWLGIWAAFFTSVIPAGLSQPWTVGEKAVAVTSLTGSTAYQMGIGNLKVDLTTADFRKSPQQPDRVTATVGLGQLNIVVPKGAKVTVHAKGRAGDLVATGSNQSSGQMMSTPMTGPVTEFRRDGVNWDETVTYGSGTGTDDIVVDAQVGLGEIQITQAAN